MANGPLAKDRSMAYGVWHTAHATGHSSVLQTLLPSVTGHSAPSPMRGVITERVRVLSPPSHDNEQLLHNAQSDT